MSIRITVPLLVVTGLCWPVGAHANLGDTLSAAKARAAVYAQRYRAVDPLFRTDSKGLVVRECWAAPPEMWAKDEAMRLAGDLLPPALRKAKPKVLPKDGSEEALVYADGTRVVLNSSLGKYIGVEVRAASFTGPGC